jgi:hypothetical protein
MSGEHMANRKETNGSNLPKTVRDLKPAPYNEESRVMSEIAGAALTTSMDEFGDISGIVFNLRTGRLVSGHRRKERLPQDAEITDYVERQDNAGTVGYGRIHAEGRYWLVRFVDWQEAKEKAANIAANNRHISADYVAGPATDILEELKALCPDIFDQTLMYKIGDELSSHKSAAEAVQDVGALPEYDLTPLPYESYNYVVVLFRNDIDWTSARDHFELKPVKEGPVKNGKVGLGRVIDGANYLAKIRGKLAGKK